MAGIDMIAETLDANPDIRLVVIDTLQRFRSGAGGPTNAYANDYEALAPLQQLCRDRAGLGIVVVHHKRKALADDGIDSINGSAAIAGAADSIWLVSRKGGDFVLNVRARDWEQDEDEFLIERDRGQWRLSNQPRFSPHEVEALKLLDVTTGMSGVQMAQALRVSRQAAHARLRRLQGRGLVRFQEGAWLLVNP
jgi:hypothetical protein